MSTQSWHPTTALDQLSEGWIEGVAIAETKLILIRSGDEVAAFSDACPHEGFPLSKNGLIEEGVLVCQKHLWEFDPATGKHISRLERPECNLKRYPVRVVDGTVEVELNDGD